MADDVTLNPMSGGPVVATDEVPGTGEHVQIVKLAYSADGDRTAIDADATGLRTFVTGTVVSGGTYSVGDNGFPALVVDSSGNWSPLSLDLTGNLKTVVEGFAYVKPDPTSSAFPISDNGGSLTVDGTVGISGTVAATQSGTWNVGQNSSTPWNVIERGTTIASTSASVTTTSGQIVASSATRRSVVLTNLGTDNVWIGASGVTDNQGIRLAPGQTLTIDKSPTAAVHAKAASGTQTVAVFTESD